MKTFSAKLQLHFLKSTLEPPILAICRGINCIQTRPERFQSVSDKFHMNLKVSPGEQIKLFLTKYRSCVCFRRNCQEPKSMFHVAEISVSSIGKTLWPWTVGAALLPNALLQTEMNYTQERNSTKLTCEKGI